ncbi:hypothetical protein [Paracoccus thiocyanatus]|nr:hypothetical protein [Paracoccus thiocyanatus]
MSEPSIVPTAEQLPTESARVAPMMELEVRDGKFLHVQTSGDFGRLDAAASNSHVAAGLLEQMADIGSYRRAVDPAASNFALGFVDSMEPQDATEALLLTQMAAIHQATMHMARRLNCATILPQQDSAEKALNKLARTYAAQVEALKRYRSKGQQVVRVERVTVESGAQAVVGNVSHGGRGHGES